ncbi:MAG: hypothetical protein WAK33_21555 [Silvibacterium sp.]
MMSSHTITLFTAPPPSGSGLSSFAVSMLVHGTAIGMVSVALQHTTHIIDDRQINQRYSLHLLEVHSTATQERSSAGSSIIYPGPHAAAAAAQSGGRPAAPASVPKPVGQLVTAPQTLVQPDLPPDIVLPQEIPIPAALLWSPANSPIKKIIPPPPHETTTADVPPSLDPPNRELNLADLKISATSFATVTPAPLPGTTSPLVISGHEPVQRVPEMATSPAGTPTPARVMSISDLQLLDGIIALPPANETASASSSEALLTGHGKSGAQAGRGDSPSEQPGSGAGKGAGNKGGKDPGNEVTNKEEKATTEIGSAAKKGANTGARPVSGAISGSSLSESSSVNRINLPKDGRFGVMVVGSSLADQYPEVLGVWGGRLAYTVYVHAGLARNWILQYSVPRSADAAAAGDVVRPDAPWPFYIVVPHIALNELNADAIMVHGFVNTAGCFEQLAVVSPSEFAQKEFVLNTLQEWKFRPATQNGQVTTVEVLLIIPEEPD